MFVGVIDCKSMFFQKMMHPRMATINTTVSKRFARANRKRNKLRPQTRTRAAETVDRPRECRYPNKRMSRPRTRTLPAKCFLLSVFIMILCGERLVVPACAGMTAEGLPAARFSGKIPQAEAEDDFFRNRIAASTLPAGKRPGATFAHGSGTTSRNRRNLILNPNRFV